MNNPLRGEDINECVVLADFDRFGRADMLFAKDDAIGAPLIWLHAVQYLPAQVQKHLTLSALRI